MLQSIHDEAEKNIDDLDWAAATQYALDSLHEGEADYADIDFLIDQDLADERETERRYAYETRTGRDAPVELPERVCSRVSGGCR